MMDSDQRVSKGAYAAAGVDIDAMNRAIDLMSDAVRSTYGPEVLLGIGAFGGLYDGIRLKEMDAPVLVASTDGVGTKTVVASSIGSYASLGWDIVNHCINDILVQGAEPLFFLDYIAAPVLDPEIVATIVGGAAGACREAGCALLGGETSEMPGVYAPGHMDVVGAIVGVVDRDGIIDGSGIEAGDVLVGLPSSGLHTNGFSLVRKIFEPAAFHRHEEALGRTLGEALVEPHRSYLPHVRAMRPRVAIKGMAHITGGGFVDNVPRILPAGLGAVIDRASWQVPAIFQLIESAGAVDHDEMYRVLNMGVGLVVVVAPEEVDLAIEAVRGEAYAIGEVVPHRAGERVRLT